MAKSKVIWKKQSPLGLIEVRDRGDVFFYSFYSDDNDWFIGSFSDEFDEEEILNFWEEVQLENLRQIRDAKLSEEYDKHLAKAH